MTLRSGCSISFSGNTQVDPASLATFDASGNVNGGMAYNLNTVTSATTLTLNATVCNKFTQA